MLPSDDDALLALAGIVDPPPPEEGLFRRDSWLRRVSAESVLLLGGGRALLLEVAHPLVAAGVPAPASARPFGGCSALARSGDRATARRRSPRRAGSRAQRDAAARRRGPFAAGTAYSGRDPDLVLWVWGTLVDTALAVYRDFVAPLDAAALAEYHRDQRALALLLGAPADRTPGDPESFRSWFDGMIASDALTVGPAAREIARAVLETRGVERGPVPMITAALLPARLRGDFGLAWNDERQRRYRELVAGVRSLRRERPVDARSECG
jgi:uncharacterized protein (DUF2236 family)